MIYPDFLKHGSRITVTAPSAGIRAEKTEGFELSLSRIAANGWQIKETASVRTGLPESAEPKIRGDEFNEALTDGSDAVICACGGDFLPSMMEYTDLGLLKNNVKWLQGYSDPTHLLFPVTTCLDIATVYGCNAGGFDTPEPGNTAKYCFDILKGDIPLQKSFDYWLSFDSDGAELRHPVYWETPSGAFHRKGRLLGGCMDCLNDLIGTKYDGMKAFNKRYADDGIIWYFDVFALTAEGVYLSLWHMKEAGWLENAVGYVFGRVMQPNSYAGITYEEGIKKAIGDAPLIMNADVGHVWPRMTFVNGAIGSIDCSNGKATLKTEFI